jgi:hypothetical protein
MTERKDRLRVLIVEDSTFMRKVLHDIIAADPEMEIVGEARDGREGVELAQTLKPDVIRNRAKERVRRFGLWSLALWILCRSLRVELIWTCAGPVKS